MDKPYYGLDLFDRALWAPPLVYQGVRKIISGITWEPKDFPQVKFSDYGYGPNKLRQLERNYIDGEEIKRVKTILERRKDQSFTSVALSLRGATKDSRSMGWCMLSLVASRTKTTETVEVHYRSTELILKFGGDLCFLPSIFDRLGLDPDSVRFRFANCFLSGVYFPYACRFWKPVDFLRTVYDTDKKLFAQGTRFFLRSSYKEDQVFPYSPENVAHRFAWKHLKKEMPKIRDYLESKHKKYGKPLPKTHYAEGEYVPRGKRKHVEEDS